MLENHVRVATRAAERDVVITIHVDMKDLAWVSLNRDQALQLARNITEHASRLAYAGAGGGSVIYSGGGAG